MSKILLPTPDAPPKRGGVARSIGATLRARGDVEVDVLPERWGTLRVFLHVLRSLGNAHVKSIWTHHIFPVGTASYFVSFFLSQCSYTVFLHGLDFDLARRNAWKRFLARRILCGAKSIVTNSAALRHEVASFVHRDDILVVYPCVSADFVRASETTRKGLVHRTPEELALLFLSQMIAMSGSGVSISRNTSEDMVRLLTVARLVERKGHVKVLRAMIDLANVTYTIVGDGPLREALQREAQTLGVADRVTFLTEVTDEQLPELYTAHDIFVMPTTKSERDREGFGIVYAEAGLFGLPCVATDIPGVDEVIIHEETGLLIEDTPLALGEAMRKLVGFPGLRSRMGSAARKRVLENFTEERFVQNIRTV